MLKRSARVLLRARPFLSAWQRLPGTHLSIFTLHRFAVPDLGVAGHEPEALSRTLERLRRNRIPILALWSVVEALRGQQPLPPRAVVFTVDDGYFDFEQVGAPVFARYDCPVTVFLVTRFLDGRCWLWWDQIRYLFGSDRVGHQFLSRSGPRSLDALISDFCRLATAIPTVELSRIMERMVAESGSPLPETPPEPCRPMLWSSVRRLASQGVSFGPHTATHPVLPMAPAEMMPQEVGESWSRLRQMVPEAVPVFAYPNGDFGEREIQAVRSAGLVAAVSTRQRYLTVGTGKPGPVLFDLPRFSYPEEADLVTLTAAGFRLLQRTGSAPRTFRTAAQ